MSHTDAQLANCGSEFTPKHTNTHKRLIKLVNVPTRERIQRRPTSFNEAGVSRHLLTRVTHFSNVSQRLRLVWHRAGAPFHSDGGENSSETRAERTVRLSGEDWRKCRHTAGVKIKARRERDTLIVMITARALMWPLFKTLHDSECKETHIFSIPFELCH